MDSLAPGKFEWNVRYVIFKWISVVDGWGIFCEITLVLISLDFTDDQSILVQVMAWCRQATIHYLSECWPRSLSPYGVKGQNELIVCQLYSFSKRLHNDNRRNMPYIPPNMYVVLFCLVLCWLWKHFLVDLRDWFTHYSRVALLPLENCNIGDWLWANPEGLG